MESLNESRVLQGELLVTEAFPRFEISPSNPREDLPIKPALVGKLSTFLKLLLILGVTSAVVVSCSTSSADRRAPLGATLVGTEVVIHAPDCVSTAINEITLLDNTNASVLWRARLRGDESSSLRSFRIGMLPDDFRTSIELKHPIDTSANLQILVVFRGGRVGTVVFRISDLRPGIVYSRHKSFDSVKSFSGEARCP
jgi:hypothetical protein